MANVDFTLLGGTPGIADFDNIVNNVGKVSGKGGGGGSGGTIFLDNGASNLLLGDLGATQSLTRATTGTMTVSENITTGGDLILTTPNLTNAFDVAANSITITSQAGLGLTVTGGAGQSFNATGAGEVVQLNATNGDLNLFGTQTYVSETEMNVLNPASTFRVNAGANITGQQKLTVDSLINNLIGIITGNPLVINSVGGKGTIANSVGDVTLTGDIVLNGDISIIASGNVNAGSATSIDLSGASGGALTVLAGYNFTPGTAGQVNFNSATTYTNFTANATGGSINLGGVNVDTSATSGSAGTVTLIANGGSTNAGSIAIGNIVTSSGSTGGSDVRLIGEGPITVGNITTGGPAAGDVEIKVASTAIVGTPQILNGVLQGGSLASDNIGSGSITTGDINAGNAQVDIQTSGAASSIAIGDIGGRIIQVDAGTGNLNLAGTSGITAATDASGNGGTISLAANTVTLNNTAATQFLLTADGTGTGTGGTITLDTEDQTAVYIGTVPKAKSGHFFSVSAKGGATGDGGTIDFSVGGNLSVNTASLLAGPGTGGDGAHYALEAGTTAPKTGNLVIVGDLSASGSGAGAGGTIDLKMKGKTFTLGGTKPPKNGVGGQLTALGAGGKITVNNSSGGITG